MKALRSAVKVCLLLLLISTSAASAATVTLSGNIQFSALDGSAQDSDGVVNGVFTVSGDLVIDGTINCNDDPPGPGHSSACPIRLSVSGDLSLTPGSGVFAENRRGGGDGGNIVLTAGGDIVLHGPSGSLAGAVVSSGRTTGTDDRAGDITLQAGGRVEVESGAAVSAGAHGGRAGDIEITAGDRVRVAGLIAAGPSRVVLPSALTGKVLDGGNSKQEGGSIILRAQTSSEPGVRVEAGGIVVSQGEKGGAQVVRLEGCGIEVQGLVAAVAKRDGPGRVVLRSGTTLVIDGRDLGTAGPRRGRVRADSTEGGASGFLVDLFAGSNVQVLGPAAAPAPFAVSSTPGLEGPAGTGGTITAISLTGTLTGSGKAFEAGRSRLGNRGGTIDLQAKGAVTLDGATLQAVGDVATTSFSRKGGRILVRSYQADVSWTFGTGDVRPTGTGVPVANRGTITLTACSGIDLTGSQFPVVGGPALPFPTENDGLCSPAAPALPAGEPPLPVCNEPPVANAQAVETDEDTPVTITLTGSDPNSDPLTFSIVTPPAHGSLGPLTSPTATSVQVVYTPDLNYNGPDSFTFQVDDGHGGTDTATVTLTVKPVNDAPEVDDATFALDENSPNGTAVGTVTFTDPDSGQSHTFSIVSGNTGGAFAINPTTGEISVANSAVLDFEMTPSFSLTVQVTDDGSPVLSGTATITINLTDGNEAPVVNPATFTVAENSPSGTGVGTVTFNDADTGQTHTFAIIAGNMGGAFAINSSGAITVANSGALDFEATPSFSLTVQVTDSGSPVQSGTAVITVNLTNVNEAPVVNPATFTVDENSPNGTAVGTVTFTDPDMGQAHAFAITAGNVGGAFAIDSSGAISVANSAALNFEATPSFSLTVQVTDNGTPALSGTAVVTITVNNVAEPPTANPDSYDTIGNTLLQVTASDTAEGPHVFVTGSLLANDSDLDLPSMLTTTLNSASPGAEVTVNSDGTFTYVPPPGATELTDTFTYNLTDGTFTVTGMVTIHLRERVWYIKNDAEADGNGTSVAPFNAITAANLSDDDGDGDLADDLDSEHDYIFIHFGDGTATNQDRGFLLEGGQHLLGEHAGLTIPIMSGTFNGVAAPTSVDLVAATPGNRPMLDDTVADTIEGVAARDVVPVEIAGLNLGGNVNGIDWTTTSAFAGSGELVIRDNVIRSAASEGVDINLAGTGTTRLAFHDNNLTAAGTAADIQETGAGALTITRFDDNVVSGDSGGSGIIVSNAIFDSIPGGGLDTVDGGTTVIGALGNGVGGAGLALGNVQGDLHFTSNLNIFADGGVGLTVSGTGAGMQLRVNSGGAPTGIVEATGGPAVDATATALDLRLVNLRSTNSASTGTSLTNVTGTFSAETGSSITNATGTDFAISGGTANVIYRGTITDDLGQLVSVSGATAGTKSFEGVITDGDDGDGSGVSLSGNTGAVVRFSGGLVLSTGGNAAFAATGGGTVEVCDENPCNGGATGGLINKITTTTATALNMANTNIGAVNLEFRSISAGTAASGPTSGIIVNNTGLSGGLKVKGTGSAGSGGTIQNTTGDSISLTSTSAVSLSFMNVDSGDEDGIDGTLVNGFSITGSSVTNNGNAANEEGLSFLNLSGVVSMTNTAATGNAYNNLRIDNATGTISSLTISGSSFNNNQTAIGNHGALIEIRGTSQVTTASIIGSSFSGNEVIGIQVTATDTATVSNFTISGSTITNNELGIDFSKSQSSNLTFNILNNATVTGQNSHGINLFTAVGAGTTGLFQGRIEGNTIGNSGVEGSGSAIGNCIRVNINGNADAAVLINNNTLRQCPNGRGIEVIGRNGTGGLDVTVTNNDVNPQDTSGAPLAAILVQSNCATVCNTVRTDVRGNTVPAGATTDLLPTYIALVESSTSMLQLVDTSPVNVNCTDQLAANNTGSASATAGCALIAGPISTP